MSRKLRGLLKLNALLVASALVGTLTVGAGAISIALLRETPLFSDHQRREIEQLVKKHPIEVGWVAGWLIGTAIAQVRQQICNHQETADNAAGAEPAQGWAQQRRMEMLQSGQIEIVRQGDKEPRLPVQPQCRSCHCLSGELVAHVYFRYPCAVHPYGPDSDHCPDWQREDDRPIS